MRRRLKNFLPIVLVALAVQIFAPIAACWAASIAASDPLGAAVICHGDAGVAAGQADQTGSQDAQQGCCAICGVLQAGAPVDPPKSASIQLLTRQISSVDWHELAFDRTASRGGFPEQARAPPTLS